MAVIGKAREGVGEAVGVVDFGKFAVDGFGLAERLDFEDARFDGAEAAQTPAGGGHGFDEFLFDGVGGLKAVEEGIEEEVEFGLRFGFEDDGAGGEAVAEGVA